ncbi:hypothetical protein V8E36_006080 [Tilletia maclaganii]
MTASPPPPAKRPRQRVMHAAAAAGDNEENDFDPDISMRSDSSRVHRLNKNGRGQMARRSFKVAAAFNNAGRGGGDTSMDVSSDSIRMGGAASAGTAAAAAAAAAAASRATAANAIVGASAQAKNINAVAGPSSNAAGPPPSRGPIPAAAHQRLGVLARAGVANAALATGSGIPANAAAAAAAAAAVAAAGGPARIRVDNTSFEEWMKMATDNKINSTNTWSFALIDYFHDMSLLRSDSGDGTINFQKASCTLDGCVKVWTSRVDSVVVETGRLLSGLQDDARGGRRGDEDGDGEGGGGSDDDAGDDLDGEDGEGGAGAGGRGKGKKKRGNKEVTLAKHFSQIKVKNLDLEFTVDPLFKKTSADFDEGGAGGLLMNHLGVDGKMRVVFDASDVAGVDEDEDEEDDHQAENADSEANKALREADQMDITKLRAKLFGVSEEYAQDRVPQLASMLNRRFVCPSLRTFRFDRTDKTPFAEFVHRAGEADAELDAQMEEGAIDADLGGAGGEEGPNFMDVDAAADFNFGPGDNEDGAAIFGGGDAGGGALDAWRQGSAGADQDDPLGAAGPLATDDDAPEVDAFADLDLGGAEDFAMPNMGDPDQEGGFDAFGVGGDGEDGEGLRPAGFGGADPSGPVRRPDEQDIIMALNAGFGGANGDGMGQDDDGDDDEGGNGAGSRGGGGSRDMFDYFDQRFMKNWAGPEHWKMRKVVPSAGTAAAAAGKEDGAAIGKTAEKSTRKAREAFAFVFSVEDAPDPKQLFATSTGRGTAVITLPKASLKGKNREQYLLPEDQHYNSKQLLRLFLKPKVTLQMRKRGVVVHADDDLMGLGVADGLDQIDDGFWAQQAAGRNDDGGIGGQDMFDDYGGMPFDDGDDMGVVIGDEGGTQLELVRKVKPEMVNYAKKATRVDIRKLKENIWKELGIGADGAETGTPGEVPQTPITATAAQSGQGKRFAQVLGGLRTNYAKDKMDEISTSFCFICLLHLANEEGLQISLGKDGSAAAPNLNSVISSTAADDALGGSDDEDEDEDEGMDEDGAEGVKDEVDMEKARRDMEEEMRRVGLLEQLVIAKDPTAGRSA